MSNIYWSCCPNATFLWLLATAKALGLDISPTMLALRMKLSSAPREQEPEPYLLAQLRAFASGDRHNDIGQQMRNVARQMTSDEISEAAHYYASQAADTSKQ